MKKEIVIVCHCEEPKGRRGNLVKSIGDTGLLRPRSPRNDMTTQPFHLITIIGGVLLALATILGCHSKKIVSAPPKEVSVIIPVRETISETVFMTGSVEAEAFADVFPRGAGKVMKKLLSEGDAVKKGQAIMFTLQDEVGYTFKPAPVVSPITGFIGRITVDVGVSVAPNVSVATVVRPDKMRIKIDVPENYLPNIKNGNEIVFRTDTFPNERFSAKINSISQAIDLKTRSARVELEILNSDHKLIHGMFARLDVPIKTHVNVIVIPVSSVSFEAADQFVYKVTNGKIARSPIKIGIRNNSHLEILEGVREGDVLVDGDLLDLTEGEKVLSVR